MWHVAAFFKAVANLYRTSTGSLSVPTTSMRLGWQLGFHRRRLFRQASEADSRLFG